jgi:GH25 family lysozyme M1 (1,4-beta-N-acetylmuramidase)
MRFLDISNHNNVTNYDALASSGLCGVICKASEGTTLQDSTFNDKYNNLSSRGVNFGAYHMLCVTSEPETQAENFANQLQGKILQIHPVLDVEYDNLRDCAEEYSNRFLDKFKQLTGMDCIIYSCESYFNECFSVGFLNSHALWVANYSNTPKDRLPNVIAWQFSESCEDYPIDGGVDCSELYNDALFFLNGQAFTPINVQEKTDVATTDAFLALQRELNRQGYRDENGNLLNEDGIPGKLTLSACPLVKRGANGLITQWIQFRVGVPPDCDFGGQTEQAVKDFQDSRGITPDGEVGKVTWKNFFDAMEGR